MIKLAVIYCMKKITAILIAVLLAFIIAMSDQIISLVRSDNPFQVGSIGVFLGLKKDISTLPVNLPSKPSNKHEEVNLSYDERMKKGEYYVNRGYLTYASNEFVKAANLEPDRLEPYEKLMETN